MKYLDGKIFAMAGDTPEHSLVACNIIAAIRLQLKNTECRVRGSDMRIRTSPYGLLSYADAVISCKPEVFEGKTLLNPAIIIEVLSESTQNYDRGKKFERYREISSFREYLVVAQDRMYVEHHAREGSPDRPMWIMRQYSNAQDIIQLNAVSISLPLVEIYLDADLQTS